MSETAEGIIQMERSAFQELREAVTIQATTLRRNARIIDELDVTLGFAELAEEMNLIRPVVNER
jgi:DNA mismatch repair ATPase MutS